MLTEEEILDRARTRATEIRRRHRLLTGGAVVAVVVLLTGGVGIAAALRGPNPETVSTATEPLRSTTSTTESTETPDTTSTTDAPAPSTTTSQPPDTTTSTTAPPSPGPTTSEPPDAPTPPGPTTTIPNDGGTEDPDLPADMPEAVAEIVTGSATVNGVTVDVTLTVPLDPADTTVVAETRVRAARGNDVGGQVAWPTGHGPLMPSPMPPVYPFGVHTQHPDGCEPSSTPDPGAGPVDQTFTTTHRFAGPGEYTAWVLVYSSACHAERTIVEVSVPFRLG